MADPNRQRPAVTRLAAEASVDWSSDDGFTVGDTDYSLVEFGRPRRGRAGSLAIYKSRQQVETFVDLVTAFPGSRIVELGIKAGGSTALLAQLLHPAKLVAVDIVRGPVRNFEAFLDTHELRDRVRPYYGVDQAAGQRLAHIVAEEFVDEGLDLVIDDASHLLEPTRTSFEVLFSSLRTDGLFVIEDWSWEHAIANKLVLALGPASPTARVPGLDVLPVFEAIGVSPEMLVPLRSDQFLSDLVSDIVVRKADGDAAIGDVTIRPFNVEIRRGPGTSDAECLARPSTPGASPRALHVGRLHPQLAAPITSLGVRQLVLVSEEPPAEQAWDEPETTHIARDPLHCPALEVAGELDRESFDLVIDGASPDAERARELASVLLARVRPGGTYMLRSWPRLIAPRYGNEADPPRWRMPPLLLELILAVAEWNGIIEEIRLGRDWLTVRRGMHDVPWENFDLSRLYRDHFESLSRP
jgi:predicted O-methyltransferase YrrM